MYQELFCFDFLKKKRTSGFQVLQPGKVPVVTFNGKLSFKREFFGQIHGKCT